MKVEKKVVKWSTLPTTRNNVVLDYRGKKGEAVGLIRYVCVSDPEIAGVLDYY